MTAAEVFDAYLTFLWQQLQYDWGWLSSPWLLIIGHILYLIFFTVKWMVLLAPITIPIFTCRMAWTNYPPIQKEQNNFKNN